MWANNPLKASAICPVSALKLANKISRPSHVTGCGQQLALTGHKKVSLFDAASAGAWMTTTDWRSSHYSLVFFFTTLSFFHLFVYFMHDLIINICNVSQRLKSKKHNASSTKPKKNKYVMWCTGWAKKTTHGFLCNNFAYCQPICIIFGLYKPQEICRWKVYS